MNAGNTPNTGRLPYVRLEFKIAPVRKTQDAAERADCADGRRTYFGPLLRRLIGKELAAISCPFPPAICRHPQREGQESLAASSCALKERCAFGVLFAKSLAGQVEGGVNALSPFSIYAPATSSTGEIDCVEITLYASAWPFYLAMAQSLGRVLSAGIGRERRSYSLCGINRVRIDNSRELLCGERLSDIPKSIQPDYLDDVLLLNHTSGTNNASVSLELLGPTRLLEGSRLLKGEIPVSFATIVESILSRLRDHYGAVSESYLPVDIVAEVKKQVEQIAVKKSSLQWIDIPDHGPTHRTARRLGGKIGHLSFSAPAGHFLPLLKAGEILHIGKNAASGCGRMAVTTPEK